MFTCCNMRAFESGVFHDLKINAVIHPAEGTFEVRVGWVYVPLGYFRIFLLRLRIKYQIFCKHDIYHDNIGIDIFVSAF